MRYYKVTCKCGHVGKQNYIPISFAVIAQTKKEASAIARQLPRVKHHRKYAILECIETSFEEFRFLKDINKHDPYLKCKNIQEQRKIPNLKSRLLPDNEFSRNHKAKDRKFKNEILEFKKRKTNLLQSIAKQILWEFNTYGE